MLKITNPRGWVATRRRGVEPALRGSDQPRGRGDMPWHVSKGARGPRHEPPGAGGEGHTGGLGEAAGRRTEDADGDREGPTKGNDDHTVTPHLRVGHSHVS